MDRRPPQSQEPKGEAMSRSVLLVLLLATGVTLADDPPKAKPAGSATEAQDKEKTKKAPDLGMSILGNQEAPKALVIVPWKSSELGNALGISTMLDDSRLPIDKEVFMRMLSYYEIRSETANPAGAPTKNAAQATTAANRRKP
jgi:hypothetical protein